MKNKFRFFGLIVPFALVPIGSISCSAVDNYWMLETGKEIRNDMKYGYIRENNTAFFAGSDIANYDIYKNKGYRSQIELLDDFIRYNGPYDIDIDRYKTTLYGKRLFFNFAKKDNYLQNVVKNFDKSIELNNISNVVYNVDTLDVNNYLSDARSFEDNLKKLIDKSLALHDDNGKFIIKNHFVTHDQKFNNTNDLLNKSIEKVIYVNYGNDQNKLDRIKIVDHASLTSKKLTITTNNNFLIDCIDDNNNLTNYGHLEMFAQYMQELYPEHIDLSFGGLTSSNIYLNNIITFNNDYLQQVDSKAVKFNEYLNSLPSAKWIFAGDSITHAGYVNGVGFKGYVDYFRYLIYNDFNRPNDLVLNSAVYGNTYNREEQYKEMSCLNYKPDVLGVMMGVNDISVNNLTNGNIQTYFNSKLEALYTAISKINDQAWIVLSTITNTAASYNIGIGSVEINNRISIANTCIKEFANKHQNIILNDSNAAIKTVVEKNFENSTDQPQAVSQVLYTNDGLHFRPSANVVLAKNLANSLGLDIKNSKFYNF